MYKIPKFSKTDIKINQSTIGESIETKIARFMANKEPLEKGVNLIYQEREEGIKPQYDIRTDRFEIAIDATDKISKSFTARREEKGKAPEEQIIEKLETTRTTE